jgi:hypothetical protein
LAGTTSAYHQISGFPGDYVTGGSNAFYINAAGQAVSDTLTVTDSSLTTPRALSVPAYSVTRITVQ